jgi:beta-xylosidase
MSALTSTLPLHATWTDDEFEITCDGLSLGVYDLRIYLTEDWYDGELSFEDDGYVYLKNRDWGDRQFHGFQIRHASHRYTPGLTGAIEFAVSEYVRENWDRMQAWAVQQWEASQ